MEVEHVDVTSIPHFQGVTHLYRNYEAFRDPGRRMIVSRNVYIITKKHSTTPLRLYLNARGALHRGNARFSQHRQPEIVIETVHVIARNPSAVPLMSNNR